MASVTNRWTGETREYPGLDPYDAILVAWADSGFKPGEVVKPMVLGYTVWLGDFFTMRPAKEWPKEAG